MTQDKITRLKAALKDTNTSTAPPASVKHNNTDYAAFQGFLEVFTRNHENTHHTTREAAVKANLQAWVGKIPPKHRSATIPALQHEYPGESTRWVTQTLTTSSSAPVSLFLGAREDYNNLRAAYAAARRYIGLGYATASGVMVVKETDLLRMGRAGYHGENKYEKLTRTPPAVAIFETSSVTPQYSDQQDTYISGLIELFYENNTAALIVSPIPYREWVEKLSHTTETQLQEMLGHRILDTTPNTREQDKTTTLVDETKWW